MRTDDVFTQIGTALDDWSVGPDAMRSGPTVTRPDRPARLAPSGRAAAREVLIQRLIDRHGLTRLSARRAVIAVEAGRGTLHADLVRAEATAVMREVTEQLREAFRPMAERVAETIEQLAQAFKHLRTTAARPPTPSRRPDRPAWQSPYGPTSRRR